MASTQVPEAHSEELAQGVPFARAKVAARAWGAVTEARTYCPAATAAVTSAPSSVRETSAQPEAGMTVHVADCPWTTLAGQVRVPPAAGLAVAVRGKVGAAKEAVTDVAPATVTLQTLAVPEQAPLQLSKAWPGDAEAVRATVVPERKLAEAEAQPGPQSIAAGTETTRPVPVPPFWTSSAYRVPTEFTSTATSFVVSGSPTPVPAATVAVCRTVPDPDPAATVPEIA
jgi:hypothetical protein